MSEPTAFHKRMADRMMFAIRTRNKKALTEEIAWFHDHVVSCAVARLEREFKLVPRQKEK
jgi:hypothetical protein